MTLIDGTGPGTSMLAGLYLVRNGTEELLKTTDFRRGSTNAVKFLNPDYVTVPGIPIGSPATFRVRVWDARFPSYEAAVASNACSVEFPTVNARNEIYISSLGDPNPVGSQPVDLPDLSGLLPLQVPCQRSSNLDIPAPALKLSIRPLDRENRSFRCDVVTGLPWESCIIQRSQDLINWADVLTNTTGNTTFTFEEPIPAHRSSVWYRAVARAN